MTESIDFPSAAWPSKHSDPIVESVCGKLRYRSRMGMKKYNASLDREDLTTLDFLRHAQEEALDFANYLERLIQDYTRFQDDGK